MLWRLRLPQSASGIKVRESFQILFQTSGDIDIQKRKESVRYVGGFRGLSKIVIPRVFKG